MTKAAERIKDLRRLMSEKGIDAYVIPTADYHQSEYVGDFFKARKFITGFSGSYGTAVITADAGGLWTDGRYYTQAERELQGSGISLMKETESTTPSPAEWIASKVKTDGKVGFDGRVVSMGMGCGFEKEFAGKGISIEYMTDLIDEIWTERPGISSEPAFFLEEKWTGESAASKLDRVRKVMKENGADIHILTSLDDICWLLNFRGNDIEFFPLVLCYAVVRMDSVDLYIDPEKLDDRLMTELSGCGVKILPYNDIYCDVSALDKDHTALIDPMKVNYALYRSLKCSIVTAQNPSILMKAIKNETEIENIKNAQLKDCTAITRFIYWLKNNYDKEMITELSASDKLTEFRMQEEGYIRDSFGPLHAFGEHAAMMHYSPSAETDVRLSGGQMHLIDTGGGYYEGSTDITRTIVLGSISDELKRYYTTVFRAMMNLASANFLYGSSGYTLDVLARQPIWDIDLDYQCGTGHGVGYLGSIHEPPTGFRWKLLPARNEHHPLEEGMVLTDEPGIYEEGKFGIRIENELVVRKGKCNKYGQFMHFETITFAPVDLDAIDVSLLTDRERKWLNDYHQEVYEKIGPRLNDEERKWLAEYTRPV